MLPTTSFRPNESETRVGKESGFHTQNTASASVTPVNYGQEWRDPTRSTSVPPSSSVNHAFRKSGSLPPEISFASTILVPHPHEQGLASISPRHESPSASSSRPSFVEVPPTRTPSPLSLGEPGVIPDTSRASSNSQSYASSSSLGLERLWIASPAVESRRSSHNWWQPPPRNGSDRYNLRPTRFVNGVEVIHRDTGHSLFDEEGWPLEGPDGQSMLNDHGRYIHYETGNFVVDRNGNRIL